jgi:hypothetical protein
MKEVFISCPAGSGMNFAGTLLRLSFNRAFAAIGHERRHVEVVKPQIVIVRDPYSTIASGTERWFAVSDHESFINNEKLITEENYSNTDMIKEVIGWETERYIEFFKDIDKLDHVKLFSFELLTQNPDLFIEKVTEAFDLKKKVFNISADTVINEVVRSGNENRVPHEKTKSRELVNSILLEMYPKETWEAWEIYSELKKKLDSEGL